jgi:hypothetical protein
LVRKHRNIDFSTLNNRKLRLLIYAYLAIPKNVMDVKFYQIEEIDDTSLRYAVMATKK